MFAAGLDLSLKTLSVPATPPDPSHPPSPAISIMEAAIQDKSIIPLEAMIKFVRVAHIYEQKDVMEVLGEKVIQATQVSDNQLIISQGKALQLMLAMELLSNAHKRCVTSGTTHATSKRNATSAGTCGRRGPSATLGPQWGDGRRGARRQSRQSRQSSAGLGREEESGRLISSPRGQRLSPLLGASRRLKRLSAAMNRRASPRASARGGRKPSAKVEGKGGRKRSPSAVKNHEPPMKLSSENIRESIDDIHASKYCGR